MTNCVNLQASTIEANKRFFESADQVPKQAYTMGIGTIMRAKSVLLIVSGADKAETCLLYTSFPRRTGNAKKQPAASDGYYRF